MSAARQRATTVAPEARRSDAPATKAARHARIIELLAWTPVHSQSELVELLATEGLSVTQATLSRGTT